MAEDVPRDADTTIQVRTLSDEQVKEILSTDDYIYGREELLERREEMGIELSWWERFKQWLRDLFQPPDIDMDLSPGAAPPPSTGFAIFVEIMKWVLIGGFVSTILWFLYKAWYLSPIKRKPKEAEEEEFITYDEDITKLDFEYWLADALSKKDFRKAVRLQFLNSLKLLAQLNLIHWKIDKTNYDYYYELSGHGIQPGFMNITNTFEYIWYGDFDLNKQQYDHIARDFKLFVAKLEETNA